LRRYSLRRPRLGWSIWKMRRLVFFASVEIPSNRKKSFYHLSLEIPSNRKKSFYHLSLKNYELTILIIINLLKKGKAVGVTTVEVR
jgi:hypothetical protein